MSTTMPPLQSLRAFEAASRLGSFVQAAAELNLTPTAISQRVQLLERHVGATLFERRARSIVLTEWGRAYLPSVVRALEEILGSTAAIFGPRGETALTVRAPLSYMSLWLAPAAHRFMQRFPKVRLRLVTTVWERDLTSDETDIDLKLGYGNWPGMDPHLLFRDIVIPVASPHTLRIGRPIATLRDLLDYPLIHTMGIEDHWTKLFASNGIHMSDVIEGVRVDSSIAAAELAAVGPQIALVQQRFLRYYFEAGRLAPAIDQTFQSQKGMYCTVPSNRQLKAEVILFRDWLLQECKADFANRSDEPPGVPADRT